MLARLEGTEFGILLPGCAPRRGGRRARPRPRRHAARPDRLGGRRPLGRRGAGRAAARPRPGRARGRQGDAAATSPSRADCGGVPSELQISWKRRACGWTEGGLWVLRGIHRAGGLSGIPDAEREASGGCRRDGSGMRARPCLCLDAGDVCEAADYGQCERVRTVQGSARMDALPPGQRGRGARTAAGLRIAVDAAPAARPRQRRRPRTRFLGAASRTSSSHGPTPADSGWPTRQIQPAPCAAGSVAPATGAARRVRQLELALPLAICGEPAAFLARFARPGAEVTGDRSTTSAEEEEHRRVRLVSSATRPSTITPELVYTELRRDEQARTGRRLRRARGPGLLRRPRHQRSAP